MHPTSRWFIIVNLGLKVKVKIARISNLDPFLTCVECFKLSVFTIMNNNKNIRVINRHLLPSDAKACAKSAECQKPSPYKIQKPP